MVGSQGQGYCGCPLSTHMISQSRHPSKSNKPLQRVTPVSRRFGLFPSSDVSASNPALKWNAVLSCLVSWYMSWLQRSVQTLSKLFRIMLCCYYLLHRQGRLKCQTCILVQPHYLIRRCWSCSRRIDGLNPAIHAHLCTGMCASTYDIFNNRGARVLQGLHDMPDVEFPQQLPASGGNHQHDL